jgi:hypothetical protein
MACTLIGHSMLRKAPSSAHTSQLPKPDHLLMLQTAGSMLKMNRKNCAGSKKTFSNENNGLSQLRSSYEIGYMCSWQTHAISHSFQQNQHSKMLRTVKLVERWPLAISPSWQVLPFTARLLVHQNRFPVLVCFCLCVCMAVCEFVCVFVCVCAGSGPGGRAASWKGIRAGPDWQRGARVCTCT